MRFISSKTNVIFFFELGGCAYLGRTWLQASQTGRYSQINSPKANEMKNWMKDIDTQVGKNMEKLNKWFKSKK